MNTQQKQSLEQAKEQGFLIMQHGHNSTTYCRYFDWCKAEKIPAIIVTMQGKSAHLTTNTDPVQTGYWLDRATGGHLMHIPDFDETPELKKRLEALPPKLLASASHGNKGRAKVAWAGEIWAHYIGQDAAIEAAKELWSIWQEAKQYIKVVTLAGE